MGLGRGCSEMFRGASSFRKAFLKRGSLQLNVLHKRSTIISKIKNVATLLLKSFISDWFGSARSCSKVDIRLPGKGDSNFHGARSV